jgi:hypothetical protein
MMASKPVWNLARIVAFFLGQASILWGLMVALAYNIGFAFLLPHVRRYGASATLTSLPLELPLIGLGLGALALVIARAGRQPGAGYAIAGVAINTVPLLLAAALMFAAGPR